LETRHIPTQWWHNNNLTGRGIRIAILSTGGLRPHPDYEKAIVGTFQAFGLNNTDDVFGLGTQAAIIALGRGHLAVGVAPQAELLLGKIGDTPGDTAPEALLGGLEWAIEQGADVIAMLADFRTLNAAQTTAFEAAIQLATDRKVVLLAPVGNSTDRRPEPRYPAALDGVVCVGAHNTFNQRSAFSAASRNLDVLAPGEGLLTTDLSQQVVQNQKDTALATAFVAGLVALMKQKDRSLTSIEIKGLLLETAIAPNLLTKGDDTEYGYGILHPEEILNRLML
jgi:subtilisin family serine protease